MKKHCVICGTSHSGDCSPDNFVYFKCGDCDRTHHIARDVLFDIDSIYCACYASARYWIQITYEDYKKKRKRPKGD